MNLWLETIEALGESGKVWEEVEWIGGEDFSISKEQFKILSNSEYSNGYGGQEVATDLIVVGNGFWLERHEYDGSEWWEYKEMPIKLPERIIKGLMRSQFTGYVWGTLKEMNEKEEE